MATTTLPTNRRGELYYGPKTLAEAKRVIDANNYSAGEIRALAEKMAENGYAHAAVAVRKSY